MRLTKILKAAGIKDIDDLRNLVPAINLGHSIEYAESVYRRLKAASEDAGDLGTNITEALAEIASVLQKGEKYRYG